jgi:hypothetical protein
MDSGHALSHTSLCTAAWQDIEYDDLGLQVQSGEASNYDVEAGAVVV